MVAAGGRDHCPEAVDERRPLVVLEYMEQPAVEDAVELLIEGAQLQRVPDQEAGGQAAAPGLVPGDGDGRGEEERIARSDAAVGERAEASTGTLWQWLMTVGAYVSGRDPSVVAVTLGILLTVLLLAANAFFVGAEFALISARRDRLEALAEQGKRSAVTVIRAGQNLSVMLAGAQLGITVCTILLGRVGEPAIAHLLETPFDEKIATAFRTRVPDA